MRKEFVAAFLAACLATPAAAQDLLPQSFAGWSSASIARYAPGFLEQLAGQDAAVLREYGVESAERRSYSRQAVILDVTLYRMRDPSAAFGAYTYLHTPEMDAGNFTELCTVSPERALALLGDLLLVISGRNPAGASEDLRYLTAQLANSADSAPYPTLGKIVPTGSLVKNSFRYVIGPVALAKLVPLGRGDWIGFGVGTEVGIARYLHGGQQLTLVLASYPTPQMAARKMEDFERWFHLEGSEDQTRGESQVYARRVRSVVVLVTNSPSPQVAEALLQQINYEISLTWNEPGFKATDPDFAVVIVGIIVGTGILMAFALISGVAFGIVRIVVKYFFPGKVFDRPEQTEITQLGLTSKPIRAKDFY